MKHLLPLFFLCICMQLINSQVDTNFSSQYKHLMPNIDSEILKILNFDAHTNLPYDPNIYMDQRSNKTTTNVSLKLDSIVHINDSSLSSTSEFKYDDNGNIIFEKFGNWYHCENEYNENDDLTKMSVYFQNLETNDYFNVYGLIFEYDEDGKLLEKSYCITDSLTNEWVVKSRIDYAYDIDNKLITNNFYSFVDSIDKFILYWEKDFLYNDLGLVKEVSYRYNNEIPEYTNLHSRLYTYDELGHLKNIEITYDGTKSNRYSFNYNENGNLLDQQNFNWDNDKNTWKLNSKTEYIFDQHGNVVEEIFYEDDNNDLNLKFQKEYDYDYEFQLTEIHHYHYYYTYIVQLLIDAFPTFVSPRNIPKNKLIETRYFIWDSELSNWTIDYIEKHHYSEVEIMEPINTDIAAKVYPNPTAEFVIFETNDCEESIVEIYNLDGNLLRTQKIIGVAKIPTTDLRAGTYIFKLYEVDNKVSTFKILIN